MEIKNCQSCKKPIKSCKPSILKKRKFCSYACSVARKMGSNNPNWKGGFKTHCRTCGKEIVTIPAMADVRKHCSVACRVASLKGIYVGEKSPVWKGGAKASQARYYAKQPKKPRRVSQRTCKICKLGPIKKGRTMHPECRPAPKRGRWLMTCEDCGVQKMVNAPFTQKRCIKCSSRRVGSNNNNWKGGITPENHKIRTSPEYHAWRQAVFERDNYTCVFCGKKGGELNADHIRPFAKYPDLRFEVLNGRTLCFPCHKTTDSYLSKGRRKTAA
jgi:5-methylcytosine-specific restriction endonuclease McrA